MKKAVIFFCFVYGLLFVLSCKNKDSAKASEDHPTIAETDKEVTNELKSILALNSKDGEESIGLLNLRYPSLVADFYQHNLFQEIWIDHGNRGHLSDSLLNFINSSRYYGLYPDNYHREELQKLKNRFLYDSSSVYSAPLRSRLEILSTDAFFHILKDLKEGRMISDSLSIIRNEKFRDSFFIPKLDFAIRSQHLTPVFEGVEPDFFRYKQLKELLPDFVDNMDDQSYPQIIFPYSDSILFVKEVYARLVKRDPETIGLPDSAAFISAVKGFQKIKNLEADGKPGTATIRELNNTDERKFRNISISLDRYKMLPAMPEEFIWVNIPSFNLQVISGDSIVLESKTVVGKPSTPTPELSSAINNLVVYPDWTIPASIISKEILPALKKNPDYLSEKGYDLFDNKGEIINPYGINWARYSSGIPWKVVQGSGDDNALGVFKFNFNNPYAVYLHDTNQRYLFGSSNRALSHGCIRVQKWEQLADIIARRDSSLSQPLKTSYSSDSIRNWVNTGIRKKINVRNNFPLFIVYFTCEAVNGKLQFYPDVYNEDEKLFIQFYKDGKGQQITASNQSP